MEFVSLYRTIFTYLPMYNSIAFSRTCYAHCARNLHSWILLFCIPTYISLYLHQIIRIYYQKCLHFFMPSHSSDQACAHGEVDSEASNEVFDGKGGGSHVTDQQYLSLLTYYLVKLIFKDDVEYDYDRCVVIVVVKHGGKILYLHIWPSRYLSRRLS